MFSIWICASNIHINIAFDRDGSIMGKGENAGNQHFPRKFSKCFFLSIIKTCDCVFKGGYLDFSHLSELKNIISLKFI